MAIALLGEAVAEAGDETYTLVFDNTAWLAFEDLLDESYTDVLADMFAREAQGKSPKLKTMMALLYAATRANHGHLSPNECGDLMRAYGADLLGPMGKAIRGSLPLKENEPGEAEAGEAPPETEEAKAGTGKKR